VVAGKPTAGGDGGSAADADVVLRLAESGLIAVVTATREQMIWANSAFLRLVGYSEADLAAGRLDWRAMTPPEWVAADQAALTELEGTGRCRPFRKEYWHKDGHRVPVEFGAVVVSRNPLECVCLIRDALSEQQAERAAQWAAELAALAAALAPTATVTEVTQALAVSLRRAVDASLATLIEADPARGMLRFADLDGVPREVARQWTEFDASLDSPAARARKAHEPVFFGNPDALDREFPQLAGARAASDTGSCLAVPLISGGQVTRVLAVTWPWPRQLSAGEEAFLATVAGYAAQALERARLFEAERAARTAAGVARAQALASARQLQVLQAVTAGLSTAVTTEQIAQVLAGEGLSLVAAYGW
jgi:PAS domain S-box-containing protein